MTLASAPDLAPPPGVVTVLVDADACPVKDEIYRVAWAARELGSAAAKDEAHAAAGTSRTGAERMLLIEQLRARMGVCRKMFIL